MLLLPIRAYAGKDGIQHQSLEQQPCSDTLFPPSSCAACPAGVLGAAVLPVVGLGVGVTQVVRGVANTPEAIKQTKKGMHWDKVR